MSYPRKLYIAISSCGHQAITRPAHRGTHANFARPETVPCGPNTKPNNLNQKRVSQFNWKGEAATKNPAYRSPIEAFRAHKHVTLPRKIAIFVVLLLLIVFGAGTVTFAIAQNVSNPDDTTALSRTPPALTSRSATANPEPAVSTQVSRWEKGSFPYLYQKDPQWAYYSYASSNLGNSGQAPFCLTMASVYLTGSQDIRPQAIATTLEEAGFAKNGSTDPAAITNCADALGLKTSNVALNEMSIRKEIIAGKPIICVMNPGDFTSTRTYILLTDIDMDSKLTVRDPASELRSNEAWDFRTILAQAESMTALSSVPSAA